ncbi:GNAT family N-acetyltransferase [Lactococcus sp.]|uniref:GNAT family N-acetyltransferase n=1 Tax=Lactococcus sp. TaxID=44273 RepID=UPI0035B35147
MEFKLKTFHELSPEQLYQLLRLRQEVFVLEQSCLYQDLDDKDQTSQHLWLEDESGQILAECRLLQKGVSFNDAASIGRVITAPFARKQGLGQILLEEALRVLKMQEEKKVKIEAQYYAKVFYEKLGFKQISDIFLEDEIEHIQMELDL